MSTLWDVIALSAPHRFSFSISLHERNSDSIFGAFLFGLIMPRESNLFKECNEKIEELVLSLTLPLYFALSGLKTDVTQINTAGQGAMVVLVCVIATLGKVCCCYSLLFSKMLIGISFLYQGFASIILTFPFLPNSILV